MRERIEAALAGRYTVDREIGRGGMATVWLAHDIRHDRPVAIKVLHAELAGAIGVDRFVRELRLTARLQHPNILPVFDSGVLPADGTEPALPWYAMACVDGESLRDRLQRERQLSIEESLRITREVAAALAHAHEREIVHRDIKPENVILSGERVYVVDFGIAKALEAGDERLTGTGMSLGTPAYMSPEQATGASVDARTDQYSLAALLYEMLAGEPPFAGPNPQAVIARRLSEAPRPVRSVRPSVPQTLEHVVLRALERVPADRYADVRDFTAALQAGGAARPSPRRVYIAVASAVLLLASLGGWLAVGRHEEQASTRDTTVMTLYRRAMRGYEQRTTAGAIDAISSLNALLARDSTFAAGWAGLAKTYVRVVERQFDIPGLTRDSVLRLAVMAVDRALAADSTDAEVWIGRAAVSRQVDPTDGRSAIAAARRAISLDSANGEAWHQLAIGLAERGEMESAIQAWRAGVERDPDYALGLLFLGQGHYWRRSYDSAAHWADSSISIDPAFLTARMLAGQVEIERGNPARALSAFDAFIRLSTDVELPSAYAARAVALARSGRAVEAMATLRLADSLALRYRPTPLHTAVWVAHTYAMVGEQERAIWWLSQYPVTADLHYQLHLRCDPPFDSIEADPRFRTMLLVAPRGRGCSAP